jgi:subtilisin family serine protease
VKCGVFDTGIEYGHPDFGYVLNDTASGKIQGYDFEFEINMRNNIILNPDENGHGTKTAGIITSVRLIKCQL